MEVLLLLMGQAAVIVGVAVCLGAALRAREEGRWRR
jgi:hypothetical protein